MVKFFPPMRRQKTLLCSVLVIFSTIFSADIKAEEFSLRYLPVPVQAYLLREAVEFGVRDPFSIRGDDGTGQDSFAIPGLTVSDLNNDGIRDYTVNLCHFSRDVYQFRTNGFPCAPGVLILSNSSEGHDFIDIAGVITQAATDDPPRVIIKQRNGGQCSGYLCDYMYEVVELNTKQELKLIQSCEQGACRF